MRFSDGIDYGGTVQKLLDGNKAFVLYDDGRSEAVQFPDSDVEITRASARGRRSACRCERGWRRPSPLPMKIATTTLWIERRCCPSRWLGPATRRRRSARTRGRKRPVPRKMMILLLMRWRTLFARPCKRGDDEANLIECDAGCGRWRHLRCCAPPLSSVPEVWACPACSLPREEGVARRGDAVFAKFAHYPWWPATIRSLKTDSVRISKQPQRRGQLTGVNIDVLYVGRCERDRGRAALRALRERVERDAELRARDQRRVRQRRLPARQRSARRFSCCRMDKPRARPLATTVLM